MKKLGRPFKYSNRKDYQEIRKQQYRISKRRCRLKKKIIRKIELMTPSHFNKKYQQDLFNYINRYEFDYFFTGTINISALAKQEIWRQNQSIDQDNQRLETEMGYELERKVGIRSLRRYTQNYLDFLTEQKLIQRSFTVFEVGDNNNYHVHILHQSKSEIINFEDITEKQWLMGTSITLAINQTHSDKTKLIAYCMKELKPSSPKVTDMNKVDNWFLTGDYSVASNSVSDFCPTSTYLLV